VITQLLDMEDNKVFVVIGLSVFSATNYLTNFLVPDSANKTAQQRWKWKNVATSLFHSFITGIWAPLAFYQNPGMSNDLIQAFTPSTHALVSFSIGYFIYDAFDMLIYHRKRSTYELLIHHTLVILCFSIAVVSHQYVAYAALSLMVEVNSVFLHSRQLFIITGEPKTTLRYKTNALLNVGTFLLFRILTLGWMTRWLTVNRDKIPLTFFTVGSVGLAVIVLMNIILFCRIIFVDFSDVLRFDRRSEKGRDGDLVNGKIYSGSRNGSCNHNGTGSYYNGTACYQNGTGTSKLETDIKKSSSYLSSIFEEEKKEEKVE